MTQPDSAGNCDCRHFSACPLDSLQCQTNRRLDRKFRMTRGNSGSAGIILRLSGSPGGRQGPGPPLVTQGVSLAPEVGIRAQAPATDPRPFHLHCLTCPSRWPPSTVPLGGTPGLEGLRSHPAPRASRTGSRYWEVHPSVTRSKTDCVSVMHWTPTTQARRRPGHCPQQFPQGSGQSWGRQTHRHTYRQYDTC